MAMPKPSDSGFIQEVPSAVMIKFMFYIHSYLNILYH